MIEYVVEEMITFKSGEVLIGRLRYGFFEAAMRGITDRVASLTGGKKDFVNSVWVIFQGRSPTPIYTFSFTKH